MRLIVANWKANKTFKEVEEWCWLFKEELAKNEEVQSFIVDGDIRVVVCPPSPFLYQVYGHLQSTSVRVGLQTLSPYEGGSYTGDVVASMVEDVVQYVVVGHSERRRYYGEHETSIGKQIFMASQHGMHAILCIRYAHDTVHEVAPIIAYEPQDAIGTGKNASVASVVEMKHRHGITPSTLYLYGGSVTEENCMDYLVHDDIDGLLIGSASLDAHHFFRIVKKACDL